MIDVFFKKILPQTEVLFFIVLLQRLVVVANKNEEELLWAIASCNSLVQIDCKKLVKSQYSRFFSDWIHLEMVRI